MGMFLFLKMCAPSAAKSIDYYRCLTKAYSDRIRAIEMLVYEPLRTILDSSW